MADNKTKFIYSAYGKEFEKNKKALKDNGVDKKIEELSDFILDLIRNDDWDRTQLETYVINTFKFNIVNKILNDPIDVVENSKGD